MGKQQRPPDSQGETRSLAKGGDKSRTLVQLLLLSHGLGVLLGFGLFYSFFRTQCTSLLNSHVMEFNTTIKGLQLQCQLDSSHAEGTIDDATGKNGMARRLAQLEEQTAQAGKYHECLALHEAALVRFSTAQKELDAAKATIQPLQKENDSLQQTVSGLNAALDETKRRSEKQELRLRNQLELAKAMMEEKVDEVERLKSSSAYSGGKVCNPDQWELENQLEMVEMQTAVKRRSLALVKDSFGEALPYIVLVIVQGPSLPASSLEIAIERLDELPHSVYTFLNLVQAGLYLETSLQLRSDSSGASVDGGNPASSVRKQTQSKLNRKYAELGWNSARPLAFDERSTKECPVFGVGFANHGPDIRIWLPNEDSSAEKSYACFGRVLSGQDTLNRIGSDRVSIVDMRVVSSGDHGSEL
jgi:cyclophilin family peptidyl-prolyl cis-trans isomerase